MRTRTRDDGMVTVETAVALPGLLLFLTAAAGLVVALGCELRLVDAARETARQVARGETEGDAVRAGRAVGPDGTRIEVRREGDLIRVTARYGLTPFGLLPAVPLRAVAVTESEQP